MLSPRDDEHRTDLLTERLEMRLTKAELDFIDRLRTGTGWSRSLTVRNIIGSWAAVSQTPLIKMLKPLEEILHEDEPE